ncbi:MAG: peptidylprolyl isomerase [Bacteroidota bacterium]|nr:peptidylprolyl isomerase [Bacteroidota bacterium]
MIKIKYIKILVVLSLFSLGCSCNKNDDILLQAGEYKLTVPDFEFLKNRHKNQPVNAEYENQLIDNAYILAYAIDNRFDTISILSKKLMYGTRLYCSEVNGYVWNRKVKPYLKVSFGDINDVYEKQTTAYTLEYIYFPNSTCLNKYVTPGSKVESAESFNALKQRVASSKEIRQSMFQSSYPFYPFSIYTDKLFNAQKGDVWGPFETMEGYYVVQVTGIEPITRRPFKEEKARIENSLLDGLTQKFIWKSQREILSKMSPRMNNSAISLMAAKCIINRREWPGIDRNMVLMDYTFQGKTHHYTAADFMEFINCQPMFVGSPADANDMKNLMKDFLMDIWHFDEALKMGVETDKEFQLFKKNYQSKLFVNYYNEKSIYPKMELTTDEIKKYYNENQDNLKRFKTATISVYKFGDQQSAFESMNPITQHYKQSTQSLANPRFDPLLHGLNSLKENVEVQISDTTNSTILVNAIIGADTGRVLSPMKMNGEYWVVYLTHKSGEARLPYKYAKLEIERTLPAKKAQEARGQLLAELKVRYPLKINRLKEYNQKMKK